MEIILLWFFGGIFGFIIGSFLILTPIRFYRGYIKRLEKKLRWEMQVKIHEYQRKYEINAIGVITSLNEISINMFNFEFYDLSLDQCKELLFIFYRKYDPEYREDVINSILEGD